MLKNKSTGRYFAGNKIIIQHPMSGGDLFKSYIRNKYDKYKLCNRCGDIIYFYDYVICHEHKLCYYCLRALKPELTSNLKSELNKIHKPERSKFINGKFHVTKSGKFMTKPRGWDCIIKEENGALIFELRKSKCKRDLAYNLFSNKIKI